MTEARHALIATSLGFPFPGAPAGTAGEVLVERNVLGQHWIMWHDCSFTGSLD